MLHAVEQFDVSQCHGCGLCAMVCPVYQQGGNVMMTPHGLAKSSQCNDALKQEDVFACILCGACAPLCPQDIDLMQMLVAMRSSFSDQSASEQSTLDELPDKPLYQKGKVIFIADRQLANDQLKLEKVMRLLSRDNTCMACDQGEDIREAVQSGRPVSHARLHQFLTSLQPVKKIIISDGLLQQLIQTKLPQIPMQSLAEVLSSRSELRQQLTPDDFYMMDSQSFHANHPRAIDYYYALQQATACQLSWDLHRLAMPTGSQANNGFDQAAQVQWLLQGAQVKRLVVESLADYALLKKHSDLPVTHISELLS